LHCKGWKIQAVGNGRGNFQLASLLSTDLRWNTDLLNVAKRVSLSMRPGAYRLRLRKQQQRQSTLFVRGGWGLFTRRIIIIMSSATSEAVRVSSLKIAVSFVSWLMTHVCDTCQLVTALQCNCRLIVAITELEMENAEI